MSDDSTVVLTTAYPLPDYLEASVGNCYGKVAVAKKDGVPFITVANWDGYYWHQISDEFYKAFVKEFGNKS